MAGDLYLFETLDVGGKFWSACVLIANKWRLLCDCSLRQMKTDNRPFRTPRFVNRETKVAKFEDPSRACPNGRWWH